MPRLVRTRLTWLTYAQLGVFGYFLYGFGPSVPLLRDDLGVSSAVGGLHGTALATGSTIAGLVLAPLSGRVGRAATMRAGLVGLTAGILAYCLVPLLPVTLTGALLCGVSGRRGPLHARGAVRPDRHARRVPAGTGPAGRRGGRGPGQP